MSSRVGPSGFASSSAPLEKLYRPLVTFGRRARSEGAEVTTLAGARVFLARVETILAASNLLYHGYPSLSAVSRCSSSFLLGRRLCRPARRCRLSRRRAADRGALRRHGLMSGAACAPPDHDGERPAAPGVRVPAALRPLEARASGRVRLRASVSVRASGVPAAPRAMRRRHSAASSLSCPSAVAPASPPHGGPC